MSNSNRPKNPSQVQNRVNDKGTQEAYEKLVDRFHGDQRKANEFMHAPNRELGGKSPLSVVGEYRTKELNEFIDKNRKRYF